jgi:hypothetical protein
LPVAPQQKALELMIRHKTGSMISSPMVHHRQQKNEQRRRCSPRRWSEWADRHRQIGDSPC